MMTLLIIIKRQCANQTYQHKPPRRSHRVSATHTRITDTAKENKSAHEAPATPIEVVLDVSREAATSSWRRNRAHRA